MKYYLVALFDRESYSYIEGVQRNFCRKYKLYRNIPSLHIPLEVIGNANEVEKLWGIIENVLKPYKKFKVEMNGSLSFDPTFKSVNLKIENKGYIIKIARNISDTLRLHGFHVREESAEFNLSVSLASSNHPLKEWSNTEYIAAASDSSGKGSLTKMLKIQKIELWKPSNNKKETIIKSLTLRDY